MNSSMVYNFGDVYYMPKTSCSILYSTLLYKMGQDFFDISILYLYKTDV